MHSCVSQVRCVSVTGHDNLNLPQDPRSIFKTVKAPTCLCIRHGLRRPTSTLTHHSNSPGEEDSTDSLALQWSRLIANTPLAEHSRRDAAKDPVRRLRRFEKEYGHLLVGADETSEAVQSQATAATRLTPLASSSKHGATRPTSPRTTTLPRRSRSDFRS